MLNELRLLGTYTEVLLDREQRLVNIVKHRKGPKQMSVRDTSENNKRWTKGPTAHECRTME